MIERTFTKRTWLAACGVLLSCLAGCSDSGGSGGGAGASGSGGGAGSSGSGGAAGAAGGSGSGGAAGSAATEYAAVIRGTLASADLAQAKAAHDQIAQGGEANAKAAGDIAHDVLLGTTLLDSQENEFLAIDRWTDATAMKAFYADPQVAQAFGSLFASAPSIEFFRYEPSWVGWGDMNSGDVYQPYYFHFALGHLSAADTADAKAAHDQVASGGKQPSIDAGNVAHVVFLGLEDDKRFLGVDIWKSADNMEAFYTNPQFVAAFGSLFSDVSQPVYVSTDWHQW